MQNEEAFAETVTRVEEPEKFFHLLEFENGSFLSVDDNGHLSESQVGSDHIVWERENNGAQYRHAVSGKVISAEPSDAGHLNLHYKGSALGKHAAAGGAAAEFTALRGPAEMPSSYLSHFQQHGWVCLPSILRPEIVDGLEKISGTGKYEGQKPDNYFNPIAGDVSVGQAAAEPVSLWLTREYMRTEEIRFGHPPSLAVLPPDDGKRNVQGWHSDFPYLWGIAGLDKTGRIPEHEAHGLVLGIQRNICISPFTKVGGATAFKLGSSNLHQGPPVKWGTGSSYFKHDSRKERGLPYNGPDADIVEAPAGSIILYDARTWHRAGVNRTNRLRGAMLQAIIPHYIMPFYDTTAPYKQFLESPVVNELTTRETAEIESLMLNRMGKAVIAVDKELTEAVNKGSSGPTKGY